MNGWQQSEQVSPGCRQAARPYRASTALLLTGARFTPVVLTIAVLLSLGSADASRSQAAAASYSSAEAAFWGGLSPVRPEHRPSRTHGRRPPEVARTPARTQQPSLQQQGLRTPVPRGSSGYVAPAALPNAGLASSPPVLQPYQPPPINTFSDRVNNAIQAYPLEKGIGNNPVNQQEFIRQRANSP
jgi:hypothetical protein